MKKMNEALSVLLLLSVTGCLTTDEVKPVKWEDQSAYAAKVKDPRRYGYSIYQTPRGIEFRDGVRLHPNQAKIFSMEAEEPLRPVVMISGKFGKKEPVLLDFSIETSWLEFGLAQDLNAIPASEGAAQLVTFPGEKIPGCLSLVPRVRFGDILVGNALFYVRMATGPLGQLARGIEEPQLRGVIGWGTLKKFEQIYLNYEEEKVALSTTKSPYDPNPAELAGKIELVKNAGNCAVRGTLDGKPAFILIDPAGDFEVATEDGKPVAELSLGEGFSFANPAVSKSMGGTRIGARLLSKYRITVFPKDGTIYFEKPQEK